MSKKQQGNRGELKAEQWLSQQGVSILERNRTIRGGEIDLIGKVGDLIVFFEIRTLLHTDDIHDYMTASKMRHVYQTAERRIYQQGYLGMRRVDLIIITKESIDRHQNVSNT